MKHKHADLIHAWADGAQIQCKNPVSTWYDCDNPDWRETWEYRIKPEEKKPVARWLWAREDGCMSSILSNEPFSNYTIKLEWSRTEFPE